MWEFSRSAPVLSQPPNSKAQSATQQCKPSTLVVAIETIMARTSFLFALFVALATTAFSSAFAPSPAFGTKRKYSGVARRVSLENPFVGPSIGIALLSLLEMLNGVTMTGEISWLQLTDLFIVSFFVSSAPRVNCSQCQNQDRSG